jgi:hypothetical protein
MDKEHQGDVGPEVRELARIMREGIDLRRASGTADAGSLPRALVSAQAFHSLRQNAELEKLPPMARPHSLAWLVRSVRRVLKGLLRPWLAVQTRFNRDVIEVVECLEKEVAYLRARLSMEESSRAAAFLPRRGYSLDPPTHEGDEPARHTGAG